MPRHKALPAAYDRISSPHNAMVEKAPFSARSSFGRTVLRSPRRRLRSAGTGGYYGLFRPECKRFLGVWSASVKRVDLAVDSVGPAHRMIRTDRARGGLNAATNTRRRKRMNWIVRKIRGERGIR